MCNAHKYYNAKVLISFYRTIMTFPEYNGPEDWKAKGDLAFQLICNDQRQKFQYCLETGILKKDFVLLEENLLGRILNQARPELLKVTTTDILHNFGNC